MVLHWQAQAFGSSNSPTAEPVRLQLTLTGPFASIDALKAAIAGNRLPSDVRSINADTPGITDRTGGTPTSELNLPADLTPGYYNLKQQVTLGGSSASGSTIVTIQ